MKHHFFVRLAAALSPLMMLAAFVSPAQAAPFVLTGPTPTSAFTNVATVYSADFDAPLYSISSCDLSVDGVSRGSMTISGSPHHGTAKTTYTINSSGDHVVSVTCRDDAAAVSNYTEATVTVTTDATAPVVGAFTLIPSSPRAGTAFTIQTDYTDAGSGINTCGVTIDGSEAGLMSLSAGSGSTAGTASLSVTLATSGSHSVLVNCIDRAGNSGTRTENITVAAAADTVAPVVSGLAPTTVSANTDVMVSANYSDNVGVTYCDLYVNGGLAGSMTLNGTTSGNAQRSFNFGTASSATVQVRCQDAAGNTGSSNITVSISGVASSPYSGRLVKLVCPSGYVDVNDPCKAVYYVTSEGKRHAFPNEKVFFTWYSNFSGVIQLDGSTLASLALGANVTYRPGTRMVKFTTVNRTYAVTRYGTLRWVTSEALAISLYGSNWNTKIDDISDAFYTNYRFGADITSSSDYSASAETAAVTSPDQNF